MVSQQIVDIIIKAEDQASATAEKVDASLQNVGDDFDEDLARMDEFNDLLDEVYPDNFDDLGDSITSAGTKVQNLTESTNTFSSTLQRVKATGLEKVRSAVTSVQNKFNSIKGVIENAFNSAKGTISNFAGNLKSKVGGAIDGVRNKLSNFANGAKGVASAMNFLKGAASMAVGMIGYDLVNALIENTRASLNARSSLQAFAGRLGMSASEVDTFQQSLDNLQMTYKKIDMDVVGQQATDMAYRLGLPKTSLAELTETTAIFTDAMQRNGRSAEDSMLAMSDAMDGQFVRLKEIGIGQDDLMRNGWSGDINDKTGLLKAMNKALKEQHYDDLAKSVDTLDDAWQVLSITLSNLLEAILLPLTPAIVAIIDGFTNAINALKPFIQMLQGAWGALPDWIKDTAWAGALVIAILLIGNAIWVNLIPALAAAAVAAIDFAMAMLANPLTWVVVALVAVALAIYEVGKAFGWWTDVQSMLAAIWAGLNRLWSAFVNHPDVQAAIQAVSSALQTLWGYIQQAGQAIMEFFGIATGGEFDVVRAIIDGVGAAWEIFSGHLTAVVTVFTTLISILQAVGEAIGGFWNDTLLPFGEWLSGVFAPVWQLVADLLNAIAPFVSNLTNAFTLFANGQMSLPSLVWTVLTTLFNAYVTIFSLIMSRVTAWGISLLAKGVSVASNFVNNIVNWLRQLPGRALSALLQVVSSIVSAGAQWVSNATSQASSVVSGVVGRLSSLPGQISSALGGVVDAITQPFRSAYDAVCGVVDSIKSKVQEGMDAIGSLGSGFGSDHTEAGGDMPSAYGGDIVPNVEYTRSGNSTVTVEGEVTERLILDFQNVPSHIDTNQLIEVMQDRRVLESIARNRDFQSIDTKVKNEIIGKSKRYYGV